MRLHFHESVPIKSSFVPANTKTTPNRKKERGEEERGILCEWRKSGRRHEGKCRQCGAFTAARGLAGGVSQSRPSLGCQTCHCCVRHAEITCQGLSPPLHSTHSALWCIIQFIFFYSSFIIFSCLLCLFFLTQWTYGWGERFERMCQTQVPDSRVACGLCGLCGYSSHCWHYFPTN